MLLCIKHSRRDKKTSKEIYDICIAGSYEKFHITFFAIGKFIIVLELLVILITTWRERLKMKFLMYFVQILNNWFIRVSQWTPFGALRKYCTCNYTCRSKVHAVVKKKTVFYRYSVYEPTFLIWVKSYIRVRARRSTRIAFYQTRTNIFIKTRIKFIKL